MRYMTLSRMAFGIRATARVAPTILFILLLVFGLAACGYAYQSQPNANATGTASGTTAVPTATIGSTPKPTSTTSIAITPGQVKLMLDKAQYASNEVVTVSILNGLTSNVYTTNHQSECSILLLEWQSSTGWVTIGRCLAEFATGMVMLKAGSTTTLQFIPTTATNRPSSIREWRTGTYRITLFYHPASDESSVQGLHAQSVEFTVI